MSSVVHRASPSASPSSARASAPAPAPRRGRASRVEPAQLRRRRGASRSCGSTGNDAGVDARLDRARHRRRSRRPRRRAVGDRQMCPEIIAAPPIRQLRPMRVAARDARRSRRSPCARRSRQLWPIWIWLSSLTSSSITVSSIAPRSIVVLAPISTSAPIDDAADLRDLAASARRPRPCRSRRRRSPRPRARSLRAPIDAARVDDDVRMQHATSSPIAHVVADRAAARRSRARSPMHRAGADRRACAPIDAPSPRCAPRRRRSRRRMDARRGRGARVQDRRDFGDRPRTDSA